MSCKAPEKAMSRVPLEPRQCVICGNDFIPKRKNEVCCSFECKAQRLRDWHRQFYAREKAERLGEMDTAGICAVCGKPFRRERRTQVCCSDECRAARWYQRMEVYNKARREKRAHERGSKKCVVCGADFVPKSTRQLCCCKECQGKRAAAELKRRNRENYQKRKALRERPHVDAIAEARAVCAGH